jgi:hypothetical protein
VGVGLGVTFAEGATDAELVTTAVVGVAVPPVGACGTEHAVSNMATTSARKAF